MTLEEFKGHDDYSNLKSVRSETALVGLKYMFSRSARIRLSVIGKSLLHTKPSQTVPLHCQLFRSIHHELRCKHNDPSLVDGKECADDLDHRVQVCSDSPLQQRMQVRLQYGALCRMLHRGGSKPYRRRWIAETDR